VRKIALITGAGRRIGRALALAMAQDRYVVAAHYNTAGSAAADVAKTIRTMGGEAQIFGADLSDPTKAATLIDDVAHALGGISLLINNASFYDRDQLRTLTLHSWRKLTDVNLTAPVMLMQAFARQFDAYKIAGDGVILNMLDVQIASPSPEFTSYFCAKSGLEMATRLAALALAPKIRVNAIAPGLVLPSCGQTQKAFEERQQFTPLQAGLGTDDIVHAARFLRDAQQTTGHVLTVDGGQHLMGFGNSAISAVGT
jgi:NAD(P)-dependent dehydrogenase (short-subunit alcohol dehydrogenase family)